MLVYPLDIPFNIALIVVYAIHGCGRTRAVIAKFQRDPSEGAFSPLALVQSPGILDGNREFKVAPPGTDAELAPIVTGYVIVACKTRIVGTTEFLVLITTTAARCGSSPQEGSDVRFRGVAAVAFTFHHVSFGSGRPSPRYTFFSNEHTEAASSNLFGVILSVASAGTDPTMDHGIPVRDSLLSTFALTMKYIPSLTGFPVEHGFSYDC